MKSSLAICWVVLALTLIAQTGARPIGEIQGDELLLLDNGTTGQQNESGVKITETGIWDVVVSNNELAFEVCSSSCNGTFRVCYAGDSASETAVEECDTKCGFYVTANDDSISVMKPLTYFSHGGEKKDEYESFALINGSTFFRNTSVPVCTPKIENGMVKLNVTTASSSCPVTIKNAHVKTESTTSPPTTKTQFEHASATKGGIGSGNGTTNATPPTFMAQYWWIILIIVLVVIVAITVGIVVYCIKCKKPKKTPDAAAAQQNLKESQSPAVQRSTPNGAQEDEKPQPSYLDVSSILSHRSLLQQA